MADIRISEHSMQGWAPIREVFGFVPDPMILRAAEIYLNGLSGASAISHDDWALAQSLRENTGGILDFFDLLVTRDHIPMINYDDTFDRNHEGFTSIRSLLGTRGKMVEIDYGPYQEIKAGALVNLARFDFDKVQSTASMILEMATFGWEWRPGMMAHPVHADPELNAAQDKLSGLDPALEHSSIPAFLLGGLIFSGMAQAANALHHVQPKRARMYLGLAGGETDPNPISHQQEEMIFTTARDDLIGTEAHCVLADSAPPVLPYLMSLGDVAGPKDLFERALEFRASDLGLAYRAFVADLRGDGLKAREAENISANEKARAAEVIRPPGYADDRSSSLEVEFGVGLSGPDVKLSRKVKVPGWLRFWWNDWISFDGGLRKTLRRMWIADGAYQDLDSQLQEIWRRA